MRPASAAFRAAIRESHTAVVVVEVLRDGEVVEGGTLTAYPTATAISGTVTLDSRAASRGRFELVVVDDGTLGMVPTVATSLLAPYGNEVRIRRGLVLPTGTIEVVSLGIFRIDRANVEDTPDGLRIALDGLDRSATVADARFEEPSEIAAGTLVEDAILSLDRRAIPGVVYSFPGVTFETPLVRCEEGGDPWKVAQDLATACGLDLHFDGDGVLVLVPEPSGDPVTTLAEGPGGVLLTAAIGWTRDGIYNAVIATGENASLAVPARGVARDLDPMSPTYYYGRFGPKPEFYASPFIVTDDQALAAATARLQRQLGTTQGVNFGTIVDPSLEPGDVAQITRLRAGIDQANIIDTLTIPLGVDQPMTGTTRARQAA